MTSGLKLKTRTKKSHLYIAQYWTFTAYLWPCPLVFREKWCNHFLSLSSFDWHPTVFFAPQKFHVTFVPGSTIALLCSMPMLWCLPRHAQVGCLVASVMPFEDEACKSLLVLHVHVGAHQKPVGSKKQYAKFYIHIRMKWYGHIMWQEHPKNYFLMAV